MTRRRPTALCRSWLFVNGADEAALAAAPDSGADVLIQELEDFTPPALRPKARELAPAILASWRERGTVTAVRVNTLDGDGMTDLKAIMRGAPHIVALPKVAGPTQLEQLAIAVASFEQEYGLPAGSTELLPNIETALGLVQTLQIVAASARVKAALVASEDMAADLGAERGRDGTELAYVRQRFLVECTAAGVMAIDYPYTWSDADGAHRETLEARRLGYQAKSAVAHGHAAVINEVLTPSPKEVDAARRTIEAFETAQAQGLGRVDLDGNLLELPTYAGAKRLLARAEALMGILSRGGLRA